MRLFLSLLLALLLGNRAGAQNLTLVGQLHQNLKTADAAGRIEIYNTIGFEYRYSFPDSTIFYCTKAFELGKQLKIKKELAKPLSFIGLAYANKGDYQSSLDYHHHSLEIASQQNDSLQLAFCHNNLGRMYFDQGDLVRAYDNFLRAKDIFEVLHDKSGLAYVYRSLANLHSSQKEYDKAIEMSNNAYRLRNEQGEQRLIISSLMELGLIQQAAGNTEGALENFLKADSLAVKTNNPATRVELAVGLAEILLASGKLQEAHKKINEVKSAISLGSNQKLFLRAEFLEANYYFHTKKYGSAIPLLKKVLESAESTNTISFQRDATRLLAEIYQAQGNAALATEYQNRYRIYSQMLQNSDLSRQIDRLQFQLEMEKKEKENEALRAHEAESKILLRQQRIENILLIILIGSIGAIAFIIWTTSRRRRLINHKLALQNEHILLQREEIGKQNETLSRSNQVLFDLNQEKNTLMNIVAHDLKSPLNRIKGLLALMEMSGPTPASQQEYLELIKKSTQSGLDLITDLLDVNELDQVTSSPHFKKVNIQEILEERIQTQKLAAEQKLIQLDLTIEKNTQLITDDNYVSRIVDNVLSNAIKFSPKGSRVVMKSYQTDDHVVLSIKDNGPGFSEADRKFIFQKFKKLSARPTGGESSNGLGLAIVKTLVDRLNGKIDLISEPGAGSEFIISIPIHSTSPH